MARRKLRKKPVPEAITQEEILNIINSPRLKLETKALLSLMYVTGGRISEVLLLRPMDIHHSEGEDSIAIDMVTKKNKKSKNRVVPVILNPIELEMMRIAKKYIAAREIKTVDKIFPFGQNKAWRKLKMIKISIRVTTPEGERQEEYPLALYPHYFRHCRATHFVTLYHLNAFELTNVMGWSDARPAEVYVHLDSSHIADTMRREYKKKVD